MRTDELLKMQALKFKNEVMERNPDFENDDDKRIIDAITQKLAEFNCTKQKPYLITISAGTSVFYPQCDLSISDALSQVDERMYEVKKLRKKEIDNRM